VIVCHDSTRAMRIHHLNCCTMCPAAGSLVNRHGRMVAHCLLIETPSAGLVLVDTGIGLDDVADLGGRLGSWFVAIAGVRAAPQETAARQVEALGFRRDDVRHIVVTHLDLDHAGGLPDFPSARVHLHAREKHAALARRTIEERRRYRACHWAHGPAWAPYETLDGEKWFGFDCVRALEGLPPEILSIPLHGHTRGHTAIAVDTGSGWLLHAGDGYFSAGTVDPSAEPQRVGLRLFERVAAMNSAQVRANHARLRALHMQHRADVTVFSAHDPDEFARLAPKH